MKENEVTKIVTPILLEVKNDIGYFEFNEVNVFMNKGNLFITVNIEGDEYPIKFEKDDTYITGTSINQMLTEYVKWNDELKVMEPSKHNLVYKHTKFVESLVELMLLNMELIETNKQNKKLFEDEKHRVVNELLPTVIDIQDLDKKSAGFKVNEVCKLTIDKIDTTVNYYGVKVLKAKYSYKDYEPELDRNKMVKNQDFVLRELSLAGGQIILLNNELGEFNELGVFKTTYEEKINSFEVLTINTEDELKSLLKT